MKLIQKIAAALLIAASTFAFAAPAGGVNINTASAEELAEVLSGVGIARARAIVEYRTNNGQFGSIEELTAVRGVGEKVLEQNRAKIYLED